MFLFERIGQKGLILWRFGVGRPVLESADDGCGIVHILAQCWGHGTLGEVLLDHINGHRGRMDEVVGVEAIIAQIVHEELIDREILHAVGIAALEFINGEEEGGFRELIAMKGVLDVADRTDGKSKVRN